MKKRRARAKRDMCPCGHERTWHTGPGRSCEYGHDHAMGGCICIGYRSGRYRDVPQQEALRMGLQGEHGDERLAALITDLKRGCAIIVLACDRYFEPGKHAPRIQELAGVATRVVRDARGGEAHPTLRTERKKRVEAYSDGMLSKCETAILSCLVASKQPRDAQYVAIFTNYRVQGSFLGALTRLRKIGLITGSNNALVATGMGLKMLSDVKPIPTGEALLAMWESKLGKPENAILRYLYDRRGSINLYTAEDVASETDYRVQGSFLGALTKLRKLGLIEGGNKSLSIGKVLR